MNSKKIVNNKKSRTAIVAAILAERKEREQKEKEIEQALIESQKEIIDPIQPFGYQSKTKQKAKEEKDSKIEDLKKKGEYKTPSQLKAEAALALERKEWIEKGGVPAEQFAEKTETQEKPKSKAVRTKKPKQKKETTDNKQEETKDNEENLISSTVSQPNELEVDNWENFDVSGEPELKDEVQKAKVKPEKKGPVKEVEEEKKEAETKREAPTSGPNKQIRSPIVCILGHVDTGKTKLLDNMRGTNVQKREAGGITQQIGATFFPKEKLQEELAKVQEHYPVDLKVPGLVIIDTPGHESFSNLRSRGSGLCDIAILVVDIMKGLQKHTLESIELLRMRKTPFVVALNKIDTCYGWKAQNDTSSYVSIQKQDKYTQRLFKDNAQKIITELTQKGFNVAFYYDNPDPKRYVSIIPTSAVTGEGISDLLSVIVNLTQKWLEKKITQKSQLKCTVLEVKDIEGLGASIDVMLVDGTLHEGDKIVIAGYDGPIVTTIRALLTPHPMREMRVKNEYIHHKQISGAVGIKISANDLEKALAGSELYVARNAEEEEIAKKLVEEEIAKVKKSIKLVDEGVLVAASTLGSLEALLQFLKTSNIPVSNISIGPISKTEIIKAMKPLQVVEGEIKKEYATILAFDVKVLPEAQELAEQKGVKIFTADIIFHLFDHFTKYLNELNEERKRNEGKLAVFPAILKPVRFFNMKDPIVMGIDVVEGQLRVNTPIAVVEKGKLRIGIIESMEKEHKPIQIARPADGSIAIKIRGDSTIIAGRHFDLNDTLVSLISRESIDSLKKYFRDEMSHADWSLVIKLKKVFGIN